MSRERREAAQREALGDRAVKVVLEGPSDIGGDGFRPYHRYTVTLPGAGGAPLTQVRDILRVGPVVAVLAWDPAVGVFALIRQFRLAAHVATGRGELVEIAAGRIEDGETAAFAARRECLEELGVEPLALLPMLSFMPTPGVTDEHAELFLALVDAAAVPAEAGEPGEAEHTRPFLLPAEAAMEALVAPAPGLIGNVFTLAALQWFALNRARAEAFAAQSVPAK
ncbi:NUDIX hydrolase [Ancylobacter sonchi]|uniref:NUDIX domain-containing protein n=1 Tax=Ancylobacter sonchi TaxID=1937790 RepID=UPI001BD57ED4|nr:NUDIX hydrolase [Ancylobacter sonchi]MBS7534977.1 NUDIX hydrolase [Ancylobacter sonchi]